MRTLITLPTYNEADNILSLVQECLALDADFEVLVVDDNSPDGTWKLVEELKASEPRVHLIHRTKERGRGTAGFAAFRYGRDHGYDAVVEMDADFSHHPRFIPGLLEPLRNDVADIVVGSRLIPEGGESGRGAVRPLITRAANTYIRTLLRLPVRDCTSGFRTFNRQALQALPWDEMRATGPELLQEILLAAVDQGLRITERPIWFEERRAGTSTFNRKIMVRSFLYVAGTAAKRLAK